MRKPALKISMGLDCLPGKGGGAMWSFGTAGLAAGG
jgi:hypothetical protein